MNKRLVIVLVAVIACCMVIIATCLALQTLEAHRAMAEVWRMSQAAQQEMERISEDVLWGMTLQ